MYVPHGVSVEVRGYHLAWWVSLPTMQFPGIELRS